MRSDEASRRNSCRATACLRVSLRDDENRLPGRTPGAAARVATMPCAESRTCRLVGQKRPQLTVTVKTRRTIVSEAFEYTLLVRRRVIEPRFIAISFEGDGRGK